EVEGGELVVLPGLLAVGDHAEADVVLRQLGEGGGDVVEGAPGGAVRVQVALVQLVAVLVGDVRVAGLGGQGPDELAPLLRLGDPPGQVGAGGQDALDVPQDAGCREVGVAEPFHEGAQPVGDGGVVVDQGVVQPGQDGGGW